MKQYLSTFENLSFYLLLGFLFLTNFSISVCYIIFVFLAIYSIGHFIANKKLPELPKFYKYFLLFIMFTFISTIFSIDKLNSLKDNRDIFLFLLIPVFIILINSKKKRDYSLFVVLISSTLSALIGILVTIKEWRLDTNHRLKGLTSHWMTYSGLLMMVFVFFFIYFIYEKRKKIKLFLLICLVLILTAILLSLTRSVWIGIFVSLGMFILYYKPKIIYLMIPLIIILVIALPPAVKKRITSIVDLKDESNRDRIHMVYTMTQVFKAHPFTGVGPNNIKKVYAKYKHPQAIKTNPHLHNNFMQILAERGIFTLLSLIIAFISTFIHLIHKVKRSPDIEKTIPCAVIFVFIGFLIAGLFEYNFGDTEIKFFLFYFLSIPFLQYKTDRLMKGSKEKVKND